MEYFSNSNSSGPGDMPEEGAVVSDWGKTDLARDLYANKIHDLRSPLTSLLGLVQLLKLQIGESNFSEEDLAWYVQEIEQEALRMRGMLE